MNASLRRDAGIAESTGVQLLANRLHLQAVNDDPLPAGVPAAVPAAPAPSADPACSPASAGTQNARLAASILPGGPAGRLKSRGRAGRN